MLLLNILRSTTILLFELAATQQEKGKRTRGKCVCKSWLQVGIGLLKVQKQGRDESSRKQSCYHKIEKLEDYTTSVAWLCNRCLVAFQSFIITFFFSSRIVFYAFMHLWLVFVLFTGPSLLVINVFWPFLLPIYSIPEILRLYSWQCYVNTDIEMQIVPIWLFCGLFAKIIWNDSFKISSWK